jgi:hypothetical protein
MEGSDMLKYIYTLATLLDSNSRSKKHYSSDSVIKNLFDENLNEIDFIKSLCELELIYGVEIPEDLYDRTDLTLEQFSAELAQLSTISIELYPEFYDIKMESMILTKRYIELETKTDAESLREKNEINQEFELLTDRLNVLLGNVLVN